MKKCIFFLSTLLLFVGCSSSQYVGEWKAENDGKNYDLTIDDDGKIKAEWIDANGEKQKRDGEWKEESDGSIAINGANTNATARSINDQLQFQSRQVKMNFLRKQASK
jgi:hypothetical protein